MKKKIQLYNIEKFGKENSNMISSMGSKTQLERHMETPFYTMTAPAPPASTYNGLPLSVSPGTILSFPPASTTASFTWISAASALFFQSH